MEGIRNIYWELFPVFLVSKFVGLAPYTYTFRFSKGYSVITVALVILTLTATAHLTSAPSDGLSTFSLILERGQNFLLGLTTIVSLVKSLLNATHLGFLSRGFVKIDQDLKGIGVFIPHSYRFGLFNTLVRILILFPVLLVDLFTVKSIHIYDITSEYIKIVPQLTTFMVEVQFMVLVNSVQTRVVTMIRTLQNSNAKSFPYKPKKLQILSSSHSSLVDIVSGINSMFTVQMLLIMFTIFLLATAHLYHVIGAIIYFNSADYIQLLANSCKVFLRSFEIWTITTTCVNAQETMKEFNSILYQVLIEDESSTLVENKKLQLHVSMKKEVVFTAYNFFPIDYTLVHSMISAATTYLVILIQFSSLSANPSDTPPTE